MFELGIVYAMVGISRYKVSDGWLVSVNVVRDGWLVSVKCKVSDGWLVNVK